MSKRSAFWREHREAWLASGLSQAEYCRQEGLCASLFSQWKSRLSVQRYGTAVDEPSMPEGLSLLEVAVTDAPPSGHRPGAGAGDAGIRIELAGGTVYLARDFDPQALGRVVEVLGDARR
ncbi:IS66 family insertion sequence element accessory protein TnpA [Halorhodospira halochloris]|uniref:IS66 family insertion sequence element accessory protein TnpA n=1 Tax=Halorhodospira halochloris TaxID=1052 RepID=UPI001EE985ED|nr:hypothetical protein [Halorhodospira halochloris]MCG5548924.1 hypothetical protein [Halorhodospira halochloris]